MQQQGNPFGGQQSYPPPGNDPNYAYYQQQQQQQQQQQPPIPQQHHQPQMGNPFDPMGGQVQAQQPPSVNSYGDKPPSDNPFGPPAGGSPTPAYQQQQHQQHYGGGPPGQSTALVPAQNQSNPYALPQGNYSYVAPPPQQQQSNGGGGGGNPFDPFAAPPPPAPAPAAPPQPAYSPQNQQIQTFDNASYATYPPQQQAFDNVSLASGGGFFGETQSQPPPSLYEHHHQQQQQPPPSPYQQHQQPPEPYQSPPSPAPAPAYERQQQQQSSPSNYDRADPPSRVQTGQPPPRGDADIYDMDSPGSAATNETRNKYSEQIAHNAPPGASPLPKADLVRKKGFVLSRISFRTIVMKKWKQAFWVQYGPHTMLWFRSQSDFDDWLNNPYHNQAQRNFLIKLAVNFVHDLYKPSVRGYQVTQCRTKAYGNKMIRQFKLERWMDYGPTIAAAFGSYNPKEVDDLREALVECMRNTPLSGGIRATGAVRQPHGYPTENRPFSYEDDRDRPSNGDEGYNRGGYPKESTVESPPPPSQQQSGAAPQADSVAEETDLLDLDNWDDVPGPNQQPPGQPHGAPPYQQGPPPGASPYQQGPPPGGSPYQQGPPPGASPYQQGYNGYPPQNQPPPNNGYPQQQQQDYSGALVPVQRGAPAPYPGAPPAGYAYGAPPPQQGWQGQPQQSPYGQPQAYQQPGF